MPIGDGVWAGVEHEGHPTFMLEVVSELQVSDGAGIARSGIRRWIERLHALDHIRIKSSEILSKINQDRHWACPRTFHVAPPGSSSRAIASESIADYRKPGR